MFLIIMQDSIIDHLHVRVIGIPENLLRGDPRVTGPIRLDHIQDVVKSLKRRLATIVL